MEWAYEFKSVALAFASGNVSFFKTKGKIHAPLLTLNIATEPIIDIFWLKHESYTPLLVSISSKGSK